MLDLAERNPSSGVVQGVRAEVHASSNLRLAFDNITVLCCLDWVYHASFAVHVSLMCASST